LPFAQNFWVDGEERIVINNGAAGLPNFKGMHHGVLTRISANLKAPSTSLYGKELNGVRFDALPVAFDQEAWVTRFLRNWPPGSPAHESYLKRILNGPDFGVVQADRLNRAQGEPAPKIDSRPTGDWGFSHTRE
jgi:hypothetical protein